MSNEANLPEIVDTRNLDNEIGMLTNDNILKLAEEAERRIEAINRIMNAALKVTNEHDWVLIGGSPYLQESGATKVARVFGIGWKIKDGYPTIDVESDGHFTYTYEMKFMMGNTEIEATGSRSSKDEFFTGKDNPEKGKIAKKPQDVDKRDVKMSAYTNCINNGIKRILPGLRNLSIEDMEKAGLNIDKMKGYTFKGDSKNSTTTVTGDFKCENCGTNITSQEASFSKARYQKELCRKCQALAQRGELSDSTRNESENKGDKAI